MTELPPNVQEFNVISGLIFNQLYKSFPVLVELIDRAAIAEALGVEGIEWSAHKLPSGRSCGEVIAYTIAWLAREEYIVAAGSHPAERVTLATKGLIAMNAVPSGLTAPLGAELGKVAERPNLNVSAIGDFIGGMFGGLTKSLSSG